MEGQQFLNLTIAMIVAVVLLLVVVFAARGALGGRRNGKNKMTAARHQESDDPYLQALDLNSA